MSVHLCVFVCKFVWMCVRACVRALAWVYVCVHVCVYVYLRLYVYVLDDWSSSYNQALSVYAGHKIKFPANFEWRQQQ